MTGTFWALALVAMVAAAAPSTGSRTSTLLPLVSAASAWVCCVGASWLALLYWIVALQRAFALASNSGRSLLSYRAVLVSGRSRAIFGLAVDPLPLLAPPPHAAISMTPALMSTAFFR